ncbi:oxidoreductase [Nocardia jiangxiensis]|uniref:oxidoreductase n=1 Tax=Nocardia jiangxiensis TaxID=282685 RepID=UPI00031EA574|nr:FAD-dependent oxidoreductase [Nocardia jiangxiensis]
MNFDALFAPGRIGPLEISNRILKSPQSTATSNADGTVSARTVNHYRRLGEGGIGLVMVEYSYVDEDASKAIHNQLGNSRREHTAGLGWLADEVKSTGARVGLQIAHGGRQKFLATAPIKSASDSSWADIEAQYGVVPTPMTAAEIDDVVTAFGEAAARAHNARFDLVEVHAGHGYLITNFLSPHTNRRTDEYGGPFENRSRILVRIVDEIRASVPREFPLSIRLSVTDYEPDGIPIEETVALCRILEAHGVDVIHASGGHHALHEWEVSPWFRPRTPHRWGWEQIKPAVSIPVIASGSIVTPEIANEIIASGSADFVSLGRAMLADPDWARKASAGRALEITPCIRCNDGCLHRGLFQTRSVGCSVNPEVTEEERFPITAADERKTVAVVGGGPAGLRSAAILADRGHLVILFEPNQLGGALVHADGAAIKQDLFALVEHLVHEVSRRDIEIVREYAGVDEILARGADAVVIATGAPQRAPDFPIEDGANVVLSAEVGAVNPVRGSVVIVGGGLQGAEVALRIAEMGGTKITLIERGPALLAGGEVIVTDVDRLPTYLDAAGVQVRLNAPVIGVDRAGVQVATGDGEEKIEADTVVLALGTAPAQNDLVTDLRTTGLEVHVIGSAKTPGRVFDAIHTAFFTSRLV